MLKISHALMLTAALGAASPMVRGDQFSDLQAKVIQLMTERDDLQKQVADLKAQLASAAPTLASGTVPATQPGSSSIAAAARAKRNGPWIVSIMSVVSVDVDSLRSELREDQRQLPRLQEKAADARKNHDIMANAKGGWYGDQNGTYNSGVGDNAHHARGQQVYQTGDIGQAAVDAQHADDAVRNMNMQIARLQREIYAAQNTTSMLATLDDGSAVTIVGDTPPSRTLVQTMSVGSKYTVGGTSSGELAALTIKPTKVVAGATANP